MVRIIFGLVFYQIINPTSNEANYKIDNARECILALRGRILMLDVLCLSRQRVLAQSIGPHKQLTKMHILNYHWVLHNLGVAVAIWVPIPGSRSGGFVKEVIRWFQDVKEVIRWFC